MLLSAKKNRTIAYCRVSTITQEEGRSLEFQIKKCQDFCQLQGYDLIDIIQDVESGGNDDRKGFLELQEKIKNREFDILVVWESSRISRITLTMLNFVLELQKNDIHFISISQPELNTNTPTGMLFFQIQSSLGEYERKQISVRVKSNKWARAKEGIWQGGKLPLGYKKDKEDNKIILIDETKANEVRAIFDYYIACRSLKETGELFGKNPSTIKWILQNKFYLGYLRYGKKENNINTGEIKVNKDYKYFKGSHEPIIDEETFNQANSTIEVRRKKTAGKSTLMFTGIVRCPCGGKMYAHTKENGRVDYRCNVCGKSISKMRLEPRIEKELFEMAELKELNSVEVSKSSYKVKIKNLETFLESYEKEQERIRYMFRKGHISEKELDEEMQELVIKINNIKSEKRILEKTLKDEIVSSDEQLENLEILKEVLKNKDERDMEDLKYMFRLLIHHIELINTKPLEIKIFIK